MSRGAVALVTGATGAIGGAVAAALEARHCRVVRHGFTRRADFQADLRAEGEIEALFRYAEGSLGGVDILVNCAGTALPQQLITDTSAAQFDEMASVHARAAFLCCRRALPFMIRQKYGRIVNISSMWGVAGASCEVAYSAATAAVIGLTKALAREVAPSGVTVNCVAPGVIDSPMNAQLPPEALARLAADTPAGRLGAPGDVAAAVCFFAGEEAGFVTGQVLLADGGFC
jgi:3-oxoacyl-[acyl-carrier protein] reductase